MAIGYPMLAWAPRSTAEQLPQRAVPRLDADAERRARRSASGLQIYWSYDGAADGVAASKGHEGSAAQYPEWIRPKATPTRLSISRPTSGPTRASPRTAACSAIPPTTAIAPANAKPSYQEAKYGITCVGCHTPHDKGVTKGVWDKEFDAQLVGRPGQPERPLQHLPQRSDR